MQGERVVKSLWKVLGSAIGGVAISATLVTAGEMPSVERDTIVRRACEAVIWGLPAVAIWDLKLALQRDAGAEPGMVGYMSAPIDSRHGMLTANDVTPYIFSGFPLNDEPMVIEVPPIGDKAQLFGSALNAWQRPLIDVGPAGEDAGKGAKYIAIPPGYQGEIPTGDGITPFHSDTNGIHFAFRPIATNGGSIDDASAYSPGGEGLSTI